MLGGRVGTPALSQVRGLNVGWPRPAKSKCPRSRQTRRHDRFCFYKHVTAETAKVTISSRTLQWSSPLLFNDPFDVPRRAVLPFTVDELHAAMRDEFLAVMEGKVETRHPVLRLLSGFEQCQGPG